MTVDYPNKAPVKTTKSALDVQMISAAGESKHKKGISFYCSKRHAFMFVPTLPDQTFKYFHNPSKLTAEQRKSLEQRIIERKKLFPKKSVVDAVEEISIIDTVDAEIDL